MVMAGRLGKRPAEPFMTTKRKNNVPAPCEETNNKDEMRFIVLKRMGT
jgi:hypothetical protein